MSDLQISLLVLGVIVVVGVYLFNGWQQRQFRRRSEQAFARAHEDVLLQDNAAPQETPAPATRVEPTLQTATPPAPATAAPRSTVKPPSPKLIDSIIDYVVEVNMRAPVDGADLYEELLMLAAGWKKPVMAEAYDPASAEWKPAGVRGEAGHKRLRFAVQMSNRAGCVEQSQLGAFREAVVKWTVRTGGEATYPDVGEAHAMAAQLDRFCADIDIAIGINVVTADGTPFTGTKIRALAESAGLKLEPDGVFYARDEDGDTCFTLDNHEPMPFVPEQMKALSTRGVTFLLDVPRVEGALRAFDSMLDMARSFAAALDGTLVDDNRAVLSDDAIAKIRRQLENILVKMEAGQIAAGGTRALRLFI